MKRIGTSLATLALTTSFHAMATPTPTSTSTPTVARLVVDRVQSFPGARPAIPWPTAGRARLEVPGVGVLGHSGPTVSAVPVASVTKVMTAYIILRDHPLRPGAVGPRITVTRAEARSYARRKRAGESLVKVRAGERITQRDALEGLLVASGNNMADILARWDAGSVSAFVARMNRTATRLGLVSTHYADAHGLSASSRSSTTDLLKLSRAAMADPTFAAVVRMRTATIPLNRLKNTNKLLGRSGIIGVKTGSTRAAGGCLVFAATDPDGANGGVTVHGVVLGAPGPKTSTNARKATARLVAAARKSVRSAVLIRSGRVVASLRDDSGTLVRLGVATDVRVTGWGGMTFRLRLPADPAPGELPATLTVYNSAQSFGVPLVRV